MPIEVTIKLRSLEDYVIRQHGSFRQLDVPEIRAVQRGTRDLVLAIQDEWPVDTGFSRDGWTFTTSLSSSPFSITLENDVFYSQWVHAPGGSPDDPLWRDIVPKLAREFVPEIIASARRQVDITEGRLDEGGETLTRGLLAGLGRGVGSVVLERL